MLVGDAYLHGRLRDPHRRDALGMTRMARVGKVMARQRRRHHGCLALAVDLHEARTQYPQRALQVGHIHGRTAVNDGLECRGGRVGVKLRLFRVVDDPLHDGRRGESRKWTQLPAKREQLRRIDTTGERHHVTGARHQVWYRVQAGAVRHRRRVDDGVLRRNVVYVDEIGQPHGHEVAVRDHHPFGASRGAAGVEQPRHVACVAFGDRNAHGVESRGPSAP